MDEIKLNRMKDELSKARRKRDEWDTKVKDLERKYREAENTCIHEMVHEAKLTPEQLAELIFAAKKGQTYVLPETEADTDGETESYEDDIEDEKEAFIR